MRSLASYNLLIHNEQGDSSNPKKKGGGGGIFAHPPIASVPSRVTFVPGRSDENILASNLPSL